MIYITKTIHMAMGELWGVSVLEKKAKYKQFLLIFYVEILLLMMSVTRKDLNLK